METVSDEPHFWRLTAVGPGEGMFVVHKQIVQVTDLDSAIIDIRNLHKADNMIGFYLRKLTGDSAAWDYDPFR